MDGKRNNDLFDIGQSMDKVDGCERIFYLNQCFLRESRISEKTKVNSSKDAIATVSYRAAISIPKARVTVKLTEKFDNRWYYLSPEEKKKYEVIAVAEETIVLSDQSNNSFNTSSESSRQKARSNDLHIKN